MGRDYTNREEAPKGWDVVDTSTERVCAVCKGVANAPNEGEGVDCWNCGRALSRDAVARAQAANDERAKWQTIEDNWRGCEMSKPPFTIRQLRDLLATLPEWALDRAIVIETPSDGQWPADHVWFETDGRSTAEPALWVWSKAAGEGAMLAKPKPTPATFEHDGYGMAGTIAYVAPHELDNEIEIFFPPNYFGEKAPPQRITIESFVVTEG